MARVKDRSIELEEDFIKIKLGKIEIPRATRVTSSGEFDEETGTYFIRLIIERDRPEDNITIEIENTWEFPLEIIPEEGKGNDHKAMSHLEDAEDYRQWKRGQ